MAPLLAKIVGYEADHAKDVGFCLTQVLDWVALVSEQIRTNTCNLGEGASKARMEKLKRTESVVSRHVNNRRFASSGWRLEKDLVVPQPPGAKNLPDWQPKNTKFLGTRTIDKPGTPPNTNSEKVTVGDFVTLGEHTDVFQCALILSSIYVNDNGGKGRIHARVTSWKNMETGAECIGNFGPPTNARVSNYNENNKVPPQAYTLTFMIWHLPDNIDHAIGILHLDKKALGPKAQQDVLCVFDPSAGEYLLFGDDIAFWKKLKEAYKANSFGVFKLMIQENEYTPLTTPLSVLETQLKPTYNHLGHIAAKAHVPFKPK